MKLGWLLSLVLALGCGTEGADKSPPGSAAGSAGTAGAAGAPAVGAVCYSDGLCSCATSADCQALVNASPDVLAEYSCHVDQHICLRCRDGGCEILRVYPTPPAPAGS